MRHRARLATTLLLALTLRAASAQPYNPGGGRGDPYAPQNQPAPPAGPRYPLPPPPVAPEASQALRYPLQAGPQTQNAPPGPQAASFVPPMTPPALHAPEVRVNVFEPGVMVARVGDKVIFYGEVAANVNLVIDPYLAKAKSEAERKAIESQIETEREGLTKNVLRQMVQDKLLYHEFDQGMKKKIGKDAKKYNEARSSMQKKIRTYFEKSLNDCRERLQTASPELAQKIVAQDPTIGRLAQLMKDRQLESLGELDGVLRQFGTTLDQQISAFGEHQLGMSAVGSKITKPEVTHQDMLDYYGEHATDYAVPAKARFEILTVKFANFPSRQEAKNQIAEMGNAVFLGGTKFAAVASKFSQEPNAASGGYYDWTSQGSLASKPIDQALFTLETGKLSQIIEDDTGYHIVRVLERQLPSQVSFLDAQPEIKKAIEAQKRIAEQKEILKDLQTRTAVWTIYDDAATAGAPPGTKQR